MTSPHLPPRVRSVGRALPPHYADQGSLAESLRRLFAERQQGTRQPIVEHLELIHRASEVEGRHLALPLAEYAHIGSFARRNGLWTRLALDLAEEAARDALGRAGMTPWAIDHVFFVTVTGVAAPSIDARLVNRLGLRSDVKRTPIFGLGCAAGAAGTALASDYLRAFPEETALLLSVELCSLTLQTDDFSVENVIATGLFGDGGAAVVLAGGARDEGAGPRVTASRSVLYPGTEEVLGWEVIDTGFKIVLSGKLPALARQCVRGDIVAFLGARGLCPGDVRHWIVHTGGPKVLRELEASLELPRDAFEHSWSSLHRLGNLSSASVLFIMGDLIDRDVAQRGDCGLMLAMGPGFSSELVLLEW